MEITSEMWQKAYWQLKKRYVLSIARCDYKLKEKCEQLMKRYDSGEDTEELYNEIMKLC